MAPQREVFVRRILPVIGDSHRVAAARCLRKLDVPADTAGFDDLLARLDALPGRTESAVPVAISELEPIE